MISKRVLSVEQMYRQVRIRVRNDLEIRAGQIRRAIKAGNAPKEQMVMIRDYASEEWCGPELLRAVLPDRLYPFVCNDEDRLLAWKYARLATEEEVKGASQ